MTENDKETWSDKLRYKGVKLQKMIETDKSIMDNAKFEKDQKYFFKKEEGDTILDEVQR